MKRPSLPPRKPRTPLPGRTHPLARSGIKRSGKPIPKIGKSKAKRRARNAAYYRSAEWRDVKQRTHEHDGYRCTMVFQALMTDCRGTGIGVRPTRCWNIGEIVNGQQTARGLVCDEVSYGRRGDGTKGSGTHEPGQTTRSLCVECNKLETTSKRANWMR